MNCYNIDFESSSSESEDECNDSDAESPFVRPTCKEMFADRNLDTIKRSVDYQALSICSSSVSSSKLQKVTFEVLQDSPEAMSNLNKYVDSQYHGDLSSSEYKFVYIAPALSTPMESLP